MAVIAQWMCDRDNSMFNSKKEADAHDKMLELGEQFTALMLEKMPNILYAEPDYQRSRFSISGVETNDPRSDELWYLKSIQADSAWEIYND